MNTHNSAYKMKGFCEIISKDVRTGVKTLVGEHNVVCDNLRLIMRNLMFGKYQITNQDGQIIEKDAPRITHLVLGDGGKTLADANTMQEATAADTKLINPLVWVPVLADDNYPDNKMELTEWNGHQAIKYSFVLSKDQANTDKGFFLELGLAIPVTDFRDNYLVTRITRTQAIVKTINEELYFNYYLGF